MDLKQSRTVSALLAAAALSVAPAAYAQPAGTRTGALAGQPVRHDENTLAERVLQLERNNANLVAKIQAQQAQIDQLRAQPQSVTQKDFNDLNLKVWALQSEVAGLKSKLYNHTHTYSTQHVHYHNIKCESSDKTTECVHIDSITNDNAATGSPN